MRLPIRLEKCPLIDCIIEVRFNTNIVNSAVFGVIYNQIRSDYPGTVNNLPISQLPEAIRNSDPNLRFKPLYRIEGDKTVIQIGPDVINLSSKMPYIGWDEFSRVAVKVFNKAFDSGAVGHITRLGHRYINFIDRDVTSELAMTFSLDRIGTQSVKSLNIRTLITDGEYVNSLTFANDGHYKEKSGSLIDIDTSREYADDYFKDNIEQELFNAHQSEKNLFFSLLKEPLLDSLKPIYNE